MNDLIPGAPGQRIARVVSKIARRAIGFVLLTLTVGLTTCSALDAVKTADRPGAAAPAVIDGGTR